MFGKYKISVFLLTTFSMLLASCQKDLKISRIEEDALEPSVKADFKPLSLFQHQFIGDIPVNFGGINQAITPSPTPSEFKNSNDAAIFATNSGYSTQHGFLKYDEISLSQVTNNP